MSTRYRPVLKALHTACSNAIPTQQCKLSAHRAYVDRVLVCDGCLHLLLCGPQLKQAVQQAEGCGGTTRVAR